MVGPLYQFILSLRMARFSPLTAHTGVGTGVGVTVGQMCPIGPDVLWALDFQFDTTVDGKTLKLLNVVDEFTRE